MRFALLAAFTAALSVSGIVHGRADGFTLPPPQTQGLMSHSLWATVYFVHIAKESFLPWHPALRSPGREDSRIRLSKKDWCLAALEGTVRVHTRNGVRTFNHAGFSDSRQTDCAATLGFLDAKDRKQIERTLFSEVPENAPDGLGSNGDYKLVPYRSMATDPTVIPTGTVLYIPALRGAPLSGELTHDGYLLAADTGVGIRDRHIDIFIGLKENPVPALFDANPDNPFTAYVVEDPDIRAYLRNLHSRR